LARSKQVPDEEIVGATLKLVAEHGPALTLAQVGESVGLSAATVMQRFGSKRDLILMAASAWGSSAGSNVERGGNTGDDLVEGMSEIAGLMETPEEVANITASMHIELADPKFHEIIEASMRRQRGLVREALEKGVEKGEIKPCDTEKLARHLQVVALGAMQNWSIEPTDTLNDWIRKCLRETIEPWRA
jgi:AcrR family transcriptional regulator